MFFMRHVDRIVRLRAQIDAVQRAAGIVARFCPPDAIEEYVRECARAERQALWADRLVSVISAFAPPALFLAVNGTYAILAAITFIALWAGFGLHQCMTHIWRVHAARVAEAATALANSATVKADLSNLTKGL